MKAKLIATLDYIFAGLVVVIISILAGMKQIKLRMFICFVFGFLLGCLWEFTHSFIPNFIQTPVKIPIMKQTIYPLAHSVWDGLIMLIGLYIVVWSRVKITSVHSFLIMLVWGLGVEVIVALSANGRVWHYNESMRGNPVLFKINDIGYTLWPFLEWVIAPFLFWLLAIYTFKYVKM
jgi:hypothetical protein